MYEFIHVWDENHKIFKSPIKVDVKAETIKAPTNYDYREFKGKWKDLNEMPVIKVHQTSPKTKKITWGYAIYDDGGLADSPEVELICGGVTGKGPSYYSILRQGNYLLWGFSPTPADFTQTGKDLFLNCINYMIAFKDDYPLVKMVSNPRKTIITTIEHTRVEGAFYSHLTWYIPEEALKKCGKNLDELEKWYKENEAYLFRDKPGEYNKDKKRWDRTLFIDEEAKKLKTPNNSVESLGKWIELLESEEGDMQKAVKTLVARYVSCASFKEKKEWLKWYEENKDYIFFSDVGGFKFFIDEPARKAKTPTSKYRAQQIKFNDKN